MRILAHLWAAPITLFGALLAGLIRLSGGLVNWKGIAWEATDGCAARLLWLMNPWMKIEAITLGHVIVARDASTADSMRTHEQVHVRQYERWGILFPVAYFAASAVAYLRGKCPYRGNAFEREAFSAASSGQDIRRD
jgi:hypothetical protein